MKYTKEQYKAEIKAWEEKHGKVRYLNPVSLPNWMKGEYGQEN